MTPPAMIAVIGPVAPSLLTAWTGHYRLLGVERFHLAFHFPDHVRHDRRSEILDTADALGLTPAAVNTGPWHESTNTHLRDVLRVLAGPGWHLLADSDEFHQYPAPLADVIAAAERDGRDVVGGMMLDRVTTDGCIRDLPGPHAADLDAAFPLGGHLTYRILHGDSRKIVLARSTIPVDSGNHRATGHRPDPGNLVCVHHFKWHTDVLEDLTRRIDRFTAGTWREHTPAVRNEAGRLLTHVHDNGGRIDTTDPRPCYRRVSLDEVAPGWAAEARNLHTTWRPRPAQ